MDTFLHCTSFQSLTSPVYWRSLHPTRIPTARLRSSMYCATVRQKDVNQRRLDIYLVSVFCDVNAGAVSRVWPGEYDFRPVGIPAGTKISHNSSSSLTSYFCSCVGRHLCTLNSQVSRVRLIPGDSGPSGSNVAYITFG